MAARRTHSITEPAGGASAPPARQPSKAQPAARPRVRPNIILLFAMGYLTVLVYVGALIYLGATPDTVIESVKEMIMALIVASVTMANSVLKADEAR